MCPVKEISWFLGLLRFRVKGLDDDQLNFHALRQNAFDEDARLLAGVDVLSAFGKTREIWGKLYKNPVVLNAAQNARNGE